MFYRISSSISFFIFLNVTIAFSQSYVPFPTDSAYWRVNHYTDFGTTYVYQYFIDGDTVINSVHYKKFGQSWDSGGYHYSGAFRDDTSSRIVYYIPPNSSNEEVWFDFNLDVGDTIRGYFENPWNTTISMVDTIVLGGIPRKRLQFNAINMNPYFVEGIGNLCGMLQTLDQIMVSYELVCFVQNGLTIYPDATTTCMLIDKVIEQVDLININISKNPFTDYTIVTHQEKIIESIQLYDYLGKEILNKQVNNNNFQLSTQETGRGIFFCKINILNEPEIVVKLIAQ